MPRWIPLLAAGLLFSACSSGPTDTTSPSTASSATPSTSAVDVRTSETLTTDSPTTTERVATPARLRGTAYTFNTPDPIPGATIRVEELPEVSTITGADGSYELELPVGSTVTPYIEAAGHHTIHVQTFTLDAEHDGSELDGVNFQTPSDEIFEALRALIAGFVGIDPFTNGCVIVTTVGDARMVDMSFAEFIDFHPHGVAGATVAIDPPAATPIYFNDDVLPDLAQTVTSGDGGVLWPNVPPGEYTLSATHPTETFVSADVRCEADWVVNANPVHGLHAVP